MFLLKSTTTQRLNNNSNNSNSNNVQDKLDPLLVVVGRSDRPQIGTGSHQTVKEFDDDFSPIEESEASGEEEEPVSSSSSSGMTMISASECSGRKCQWW